MIISLSRRRVRSHSTGSLYTLPLAALLAVCAAQAQTVINPSTPGGAIAASVKGTANQITVTTSVGVATISIPSPLLAPGNVNATGTVTSCYGCSTPSSVQFCDTSQAHCIVDTAPASGYTGSTTRPTAAPTAGQVYTCATVTSVTNCALTWATPSGGITAITGDLAASGSGSVVGTLATVNSGSGACGNATTVCAVTTNGKGLVTAQTATAITGLTTANQNLRSILADFGDFTSTASALSASAQACVVVPFSGTINKVQLIAMPSGSVTVDVRTVAFASYTGPSSTSTITASDTPALSSATRYTDSTLTGWTTSLTANSVVCFYLTSPTTITGVQAIVTVAAN
jgi:hypothetical protein